MLFFVLNANSLNMIIIPAKKQKIRDELETDLAKFLKNGGVVTEVISNESRSKKESLVRRHLFHSAIHSFHAKETGISIHRLAAIRRTPSHASVEELENLWVYFRAREISTNWKDAI